MSDGVEGAGMPVTGRLEVDKTSKSWRAVEGWARAKLAEEMNALMKPGTEQHLTEGHRRGIEILRELIGLPENTIEPVLAPPTDYGLGTDLG